MSDGLLDLDDDFLSELDEIDNILDDSNKNEEIEIEEEIVDVKRDNIDNVLGVSDDDIIGNDDDDIDDVEMIEDAETIEKTEIVSTSKKKSNNDSMIVETSMSLLDEQKKLRKSMKKDTGSLADRMNNMMDRHFDIIDELAENIQDGNIHPQALKAYNSMVESTSSTVKAITELKDKQLNILEDEIFEEGGGAGADGGVTNTIIISSNDLIDVFKDQTEEEVMRLLAIEEAKEKALEDKKGELKGDNVG